MMDGCMGGYLYDYKGCKERVLNYYNFNVNVYY